MNFTLLTVFLILHPSLSHAEVFEAMKAGDTPSTCVEADPEAGHHFKAHCKEKITRAGHVSEMSYNAQGLRDKDYPPKPAKGWKRILFVGTSRMAGPGIAENETAPRRFEGILRKRDKKVEVINAGVEGYMPLNQAVKLPEWLKAYSPTHVLVQMEIPSAVGNDLMNAPYITMKDGRLTLDKRVFLKTKPFAFLFGWNADNYSDLRKIYTWQSGLSRAYRTVYCKTFYRDPGSFTNCIMGATLRALELMYKDTKVAGAKFEIVFSPGDFGGDLALSPAQDPGVAKLLDGYTPKISVSAMNFRKILNKRGTPSKLGPSILGQNFTLGTDYHFSAEGSDAFARGLALKLGDFLEDAE